jgi:hypothetical protein
MNSFLGVRKYYVTENKTIPHGANFKTYFFKVKNIIVNRAKTTRRYLHGAYRRYLVWKTEAEEVKLLMMSYAGRSTPYMFMGTRS